MAKVAKKTTRTKRRDRKNIEKQYGTLARGMAYPGGTYSQAVMDELKL